MAEPLLVVGAGGFGRETIDVAEAMNAASLQPLWEIVGVVDDQPSETSLQRLKDRDIAYLGKVEGLARREGTWVAIGIGSPSIRRAVVQMLHRGEACPRYASLVHPTAVLGSQARLGTGAVVCAGVSVGTNVELGQHVHLNPHAVIGHDTRLGDCVSINPNATVSGECDVENEVLVGAASVTLQGLRLGRGATIGAGACVVRDVAAGVTVRGVPAR